jgi:hypothetical protein
MGKEVEYFLDIGRYSSIYACHHMQAYAIHLALREAEQEDG